MCDIVDKESKTYTKGKKMFISLPFILLLLIIFIPGLGRMIGLGVVGIFVFGSLGVIKALLVIPATIGLTLAVSSVLLRMPFWFLGGFLFEKNLYTFSMSWYGAMIASMKVTAPKI